MGCVPDWPKNSGRSFSLIPMMARMVKMKEITARISTASFHMAGLIMPSPLPLSPTNSPTEYFSARMVVISMGTRALAIWVRTLSKPEKMGRCLGLLVSTA